EQTARRGPIREWQVRWRLHLRLTVAGGSGQRGLWHRFWIRAGVGRERSRRLFLGLSLKDDEISHGHAPSPDFIGPTCAYSTLAPSHRRVQIRLLSIRERMHVTCRM